jgi:hypothetical protein
MSGIIRLRPHPSDPNLVDIIAGPDLNNVMGHFYPARLNPPRRCYELPTEHLRAFTVFAKNRHLIIADDTPTPDTRGKLADPLPIGEVLTNLRTGPGAGQQQAINNFWVPIVKLAAATAHEAAEQARREWAAAHPDEHPWSPEANRHVMRAASKTSNDALDEIGVPPFAEPQDTAAAERSRQYRQERT